MVIEEPATVISPDGLSKTVLTLFDSGSSDTVIRTDLAQELGLRPEIEVHRPIEVYGERRGMRTIPLALATLRLDGRAWEGPYAILPGGPAPLVVGNDLLHSLDIVLRESPRPGEKRVEVRRCHVQL